MRILLVDDHPAARLGIRVLLEKAGGMEVTGETSDGEEAVTFAEETRPDMVILELAVGVRDAKVCRKLKALPNPPRILAYTRLNSREDVAFASLAGADGFLYKGAGEETLPEVARRVCAGEKVWLLGSTENHAETKFLSALKDANLTPKEREVLSYLISRLTNDEIAEILHLSENTVKTHVSNILRELEAESRYDLFKLGPL